MTSSPEIASDVLLQPTLETSAPVPLVSPNATFLTAFLGGPWAALWVCGVNVRRLGRVRRELPTLVLGVALGVVALALAAIAAARPELVAGLVPSGWRAATAVRRLGTVLGLATWGVFYLRLRPYYRAAELGGEFARPWRVTLPALLFALALHLAVVGAAVVAR